MKPTLSNLIAAIAGAAIALCICAAPGPKAVELTPESMRDYFAAHSDISFYQPVEAFKRAQNREPTTGQLATFVAELRYAEAEAMMKRREIPMPEISPAEKQLESPPR